MQVNCQTRQLIILGRFRLGLVKFENDKEPATGHFFNDILRESDLLIGGMLLTADYRFPQSIEAAPDIVKIICERITRSMHRLDIKTISDRILSSREFGAWKLTAR